MGFLLVTRVGAGTGDPRVLAELAQIFLRAVIASNRVTIREARRRGKPLPPLYQTSVRFRPEPWAGKVEEFADVLTVYARGWGDCDDLVGIRCAELQEDGVGADVRLYWRYWRRLDDGKKVRVPEAEVMPYLAKYGRLPKGVKATMHAELRHPPDHQHPKGRIEDPSRFLGM